MQSSVGAINQIDQTSVIDLHIVGLNRGLAAIDAGDRDTPLVGIWSRRGNVVRHFCWLEGVAHVDGPHARVEPGKHLHLLVERRTHRPLRAVWAEAPTPLTKATGGFRHLKCRTGQGWTSSVMSMKDTTCRAS